MPLLHVFLTCVLSSSLWRHSLFTTSNTRVYVLLHQMSEKELLERLQQVCSPGCSKYVGVNKDKTSEKWEARYPLPMEKHGDGPTCM